MAVKNAVAKAWSITPSSDGKRWSAWPAGDKPGTPTWAPAVGEWGAISGSSLSSSGVMETSANLIIDAWGGAIVNTKGVYDGATFVAGTFLCIFGGGHGDYNGNEVYAFGPLESNTPTWRKLRNPTSPAPQNVAEDGSGNPVSRHTYHGIVYIGSSTRNWLVAIGTVERHIDSNSNQNTHRFNFGQVSPNSNQPWANLAAVPGNVTKLAVYDSSQDCVWFNPLGGFVAKYDVATNSYTEANFKSPPWSNPAGACAVDTARGIWYTQCGDSRAFYRTNNGVDNDYYVPSVTGTDPGNGNFGLVYDPVDDRFVRWSGSGKQLHFLTPPGTNPYQGGNAWTWSSTTPGGGATPTSPNTNGTYGRFAYVSINDLRGYILLNRAGDSIYFYRAA